MEEDDLTKLSSKIQELGDIELAALLCLITEEHCIIQAESAELENVERELRLICTRTFGLNCAVLECDEQTTLDDFGSGILADDWKGEGDGSVFAKAEVLRKGDDSFFSSTTRGGAVMPAQDENQRGKIANVVVAKNLNVTSNQVQIQALELMRGKRIFTRTAVQITPTRFLFVALLPTDKGPRLVQHLNDHLSISHTHTMEDGLSNLEGRIREKRISSDISSANSVIRSPPATPMFGKGSSMFTDALFSKDDIDSLLQSSSKVRMSPDVRGYLHDIVVFLRMHRAVAGGISALATRHFHALARALAPLHGIDYIPPSLVALAARKIYPHRIIITTPENERSTQWGSNVEAVAALLDGITVEDIIEEVLVNVEPPL
ncbi:hypothetical protein EJ08DRAFT_696554 [Tothia fuscella]|uniref:magnesium chelatase n=1 Tax=Tothia fuscella TaxID=1048955 RepID=A0A9P4TZJ4_9PEZI|nr:hypothetical protein EJ08DRAFT_696554 [Tothia fuscella]